MARNYRFAAGLSKGGVCNRVDVFSRALGR
jgi:hypothetical protein